MQLTVHKFPPAMMVYIVLAAAFTTSFAIVAELDSDATMHIIDETHEEDRMVRKTPRDEFQDDHGLEEQIAVDSQGQLDGLMRAEARPKAYDSTELQTNEVLKANAKDTDLVAVDSMGKTERVVPIHAIATAHDISDGTSDEAEILAQREDLSVMHESRLADDMAHGNEAGADNGAHGNQEGAGAHTQDSSWTFTAGDGKFGAVAAIVAGLTVVAFVVSGGILFATMGSRANAENLLASGENGSDEQQPLKPKPKKGFAVFTKAATLTASSVGLLLEGKKQHGDSKPRDPRENTKIDLIFQVKSGAVKVNLDSDVADPYVEIRCVSSDPKNTDGGLNDPVDAKSRTCSRENESNPIWNETLTLPKVPYGSESFVNILLWDSNLSSNKPIGYHAVATSKLLAGSQYDPEGDIVHKDYTADNFVSLLDDQADISSLCSINLSVGYLEVHKFKITVNNVVNLPQTDAAAQKVFGEVRVLRGDPFQCAYYNEPGNETVWQGRTKPVAVFDEHIMAPDSNPVFDSQLLAVLAANPEYYLVVCIVCQNSNGNTPIGMAAISMKEIISWEEGVQEDFDTKLHQLRNWPEPDKLDEAVVSFSVSHSAVSVQAH